MTRVKEFRKVAKVHTVYKTADGKRVPSVTTILGILEKPGLHKWIRDLALEGYDFEKYRDAAAEVGTLAHAMIEAYLAKQRLCLDDYSKNQIETARLAFRKFIAWRKVNDVQLILSEKPLVSEKLRFGGTIDAYGYRNGRLALLDFKTSKDVYENHKLQAVAYQHLLEENDYPVEDVFILRVGRTEGEGFDEHKIENVDWLWEGFRHCLGYYEARKKWQRVRIGGG